MIEVGVALVVVGAALLVAEAHVPGGVLGATGGGAPPLGAAPPISASGREALAGRCGVVRRWENGDGQVFVDGALWRARPSWPDSEDQLTAGDAVVVERVNGLTLAVRRAE